MATSDVEIVSNALGILGDQPITSLSDDSDRGRLGNRLYTPTIDEVLRAHPWNCAKVRVELARNAIGPVWGFSYAYTLPTSPWCLRVLETSLDEDRDEWQIEGRTLVTDISSVKILYIGRVADPTRFDSLCEAAITHRLAAKMAYALTENAEKVVALWNLYAAILKEARSIDGQEGTAKQFTTTALTEVR